jgi:hypothetical protein
MHVNGRETQPWYGRVEMRDNEAGYKLGVRGLEPGSEVAASVREHQGTPSRPVVRACCLCEEHTSSGGWGTGCETCSKRKNLGGEGIYGWRWGKKSIRG